MKTVISAAADLLYLNVRITLAEILTAFATGAILGVVAALFVWAM